MAQLEFELTYYGMTVEYVSYYATGTPSVEGIKPLWIKAIKRVLIYDRFYDS